METFIADLPPLADRTRERLITLLRECYEYLEMIPESAAGGDDEAVALARKLRIVLAGE